MAKHFGVAPGDMCCRDRDGQLGMIIIAHKPEWSREFDRAIGWRFEILIAGVLVVTESLGSEYRMVQTQD